MNIKNKQFVLPAVLVLLVLMLPTVHCLSKTDIQVGNQYPIVSPLASFTSGDDYEKYMDLIRAHDSDAASKFALDKMIQGACIIPEKGQMVTVEENHISWDAGIKIRLQGDYQDYWTHYIVLTGSA
jgi:hypothetical protein